MPENQPPVVVYGTETCGYCGAARMLLKKKGLDFDDLLVSRDPALRREMEDKSGGGRSVPQIFIGNHHVGGYDELYALETSGELDELLNQLTADA